METITSTTPTQPNYKKITLFASLIVLVNLSVLSLGWWKDAHALAIASVGIITFFGTLSLADYTTKELGYQKGEMRTAITTSIIVTYLVIIAYVTFSDASINTDLAKTVIENFGYVVWIVLGFYFGTKIAEIIKPPKSGSNGSKPPES